MDIYSKGTVGFLTLDAHLIYMKLDNLVFMLWIHINSIKSEIVL